LGPDQGPARPRQDRAGRRAGSGERHLADLSLGARVALVTCAEIPEGDEDFPALIDALAARGITAAPAVWDAEVDWAAFDLAVLRSTWDYAERRDEFLGWARSLRRVLNPPAVLEWNTDKQRYLTDLGDGGVPVVPTRFVASGQPFEPPGEPFVVKPAVSAGGRRSARFRPADEREARLLVDRIHREGGTAMVQPDLGDTEEIALVYLGGSYSHALRRRVSLPAADHREGLFLTEELAPADATLAEREAAARALELAPGELLYARVDLVGGVVLEVEATEPSLYLGFGDGADARLAAAIDRALPLE
jgi:glutathione synthase/RimK-type ligase-like ATP-grasp enzyme